MYVMPNRVSYDVFEERRVKHHLMVVPKRHVETLADFTKKEKLDYMTLIGEYEKQGYNIYARGVGSISRSVAHQHTHLIKLIDKKSSLIVFTRKPHFLLDI
jgi:diadenosine tetraphosphate (Ap4A) HIT family hydrolase